jgi:putative tryptophan/tyrosine transport system substrate-binding protein
LSELVPGLRQLAIMTNAENPSNVLESRDAAQQARMIGIESTAFEIKRVEDIAPAFEALKDRAQALYVVSSPLTGSNRARINTLTLGGACRQFTAIANSSRREV